METPERYAHIKGWGADLDHAMRPAYPRERTPPRLDNVHWDRPEQQRQRVEVFHSIERPGITPVFGTSAPPSGLSGRLRAVAFRYGESDLRHWLLLLAADRLNVGEGIVSDLARGHVPNVFAEMGGPAELKHNPAGAARKVLVLAALFGIGWLMLGGSGQGSKDRRERAAQRRLR